MTLAPLARRRIRAAVLRWFAAHKRALPWRDNPEPYRVWISEIMLQQTTVEAVRPRYEGFLARFPDVAALARAGEDEVLAAWSGLGYYQRARNLRAAAVELVRESGGELPSDALSLAKLPGVGRYTAGAIASIAFGEPEAILDGNVIRLLSRLFRVEGDPRQRETREELWRLAAALVPASDPSSFNQGLMELGALVCRPREARCGECPLARECGARAANAVDRYPVRAPRPATRAVHVAAALAYDRSRRVLLVRRDAAGAMRGLWELPSAEVGAADDIATISERIRAETGLALKIGEVAAVARHTVMTRRIEVRAFSAKLAGRVTDSARATAWVAHAEVAALPHSSLLRKILAQLAPAAGDASRRTTTRARRTPRRAR
ncbi:MAG: A/G-specific adenine glycosylase [bacterium]